MMKLTPDRTVNKEKTNEIIEQKTGGNKEKEAEKSRLVDWSLGFLAKLFFFWL